MLSNKRTCAALADVRVAQGVVIALAVLVGGCSADVTRFDFPFFGLTDKGGETGSLPTPPESIARRNPSYDDAPSRTAARRAGSAMPAAAIRRRPIRGHARRPTPAPAIAWPAPAITRRPPPAADPAPGRRPLCRPAHGPSARRRPRRDHPGAGGRHALRHLQALRRVDLRPDRRQRPGATAPPSSRASSWCCRPACAIAARAARPEQPAGRAPLPQDADRRRRTAAAPVATAGWEGRHTLKPGESLYGIARQHGVSLAELQRVNGITEPTRVRAGTVLSVPGSSGADAASQRRSPPPRRAAALAQRRAPPASRACSTPPGRGEQKTASLTDRSSDATAPAAEPAPARAAPGRFRWPARGRVIASFGKRPDGTHNDGINIAVPQGTDDARRRGRARRLRRQRAQGLRQPGADPPRQRLGVGLRPRRPGAGQARRRGASAAR